MMSSKAKKRNAVNVANKSSDIIIEEDDPCKPKKDPCAKEDDTDNKKIVLFSPGQDPRFQQMDITLRCWVMYVDANRCEQILGENHEACDWFKMVAAHLCPSSWIRRWDENKEKGLFPWHKEGKFPNKAPYGKP